MRDSLTECLQINNAWPSGENIKYLFWSLRVRHFLPICPINLDISTHKNEALLPWVIKLLSQFRKDRCVEPLCNCVTVSLNWLQSVFEDDSHFYITTYFNEKTIHLLQVSLFRNIASPKKPIIILSTHFNIRAEYDLNLHLIIYALERFNYFKIQLMAMLFNNLNESIYHIRILYSHK